MPPSERIPASSADRPGLAFCRRPGPSPQLLWVPGTSQPHSRDHSPSVHLAHRRAGGEGHMLPASLSQVSLWSLPPSFPLTEAGPGQE